ncbi:MAG: hypothetical protein UR12_C0017G0015 [candidate division TM6 bacterium GW2011_GWF2_30_66]|jgi:hypothetical protein|nr:MAG: hypothetical protein UR12_C0017G0015 [candidate division TM6 bacterium GW2011_GWF2_30_66]
MKIKYIIFPFLCLLINYSHNLKTKDLQYINIENDFNRISKNPFVPIEFTPKGLNSFFENIYNKDWYADEFLPKNFLHMTQFLQYGKNSQQSGAFLKSVLMLFSNKLKAATCINSYAFLELLEIMPELIDQYFKAPEINIFEQNKSLISDLMYNNFLNNFNNFTKDPKFFLDNMSDNILASLKTNSYITETIDTHVDIEHLRQTICKFLELSIGKLVWAPQDHKNIWNLFYKTSKSIENFSNKKIIDDLDNLNCIYWSLIHRFCDFLKLTGNELPIEFYVNFNNKILSSQLSMFQIDEQEIAITSKETHIIQSLLTAQAKAQAYKKSILA